MFQIIRCGVLLSALVLLPATAVCWNMIPDDIFQKNEKIGSVTENDPVAPTNTNFDEQPNINQSPILEKNTKNNDTESAWLKSSIPLGTDPLMNGSLPANSTAGKNGANGTLPNGYVPTSPQTSSSNQPVGGESELVNFLPMTPLSSGANFSETNGATVNVGGQRSFSEIVEELKQLGATQYRLEKWGNQGELFRFRCYVNPQTNQIDDNNQPDGYKYQKFFQHIDNDQIRAMEHVIGEIKKWKGLQ
ncbi:MAG: hypothetical protein LBJ00_10660 [Planctomycetaceae bacterium]|jgi:hypothetical protein|nr:hypothetical protein [Planctomycetaceae bacterium]